VTHLTEAEILDPVYISSEDVTFITPLAAKHIIGNWVFRIRLSWAIAPIQGI
jgi:hypothetical protein